MTTHLHLPFRALPFGRETGAAWPMSASQRPGPAGHHGAGARAREG